MTSSDLPHLPAVPTRAWLVPTLASIACVAAAALLQWSWRDELPARIATHSGADGTVDTWTSLGGNITFTVAFPLVMGAFLLGVGALVRQPRQMGAVVAGLSAFVATLSTVMVARQRGHAAVARAADGPEALIALGAGLAVGLMVWLVVRRRGPEPVADGALPAGAPTIASAPGARLAWTHPLRRSRGSLAGLLVLCSVVPLMAVVFLVAGNPWMALFLLVVSTGVLVPVGMMWAVVTIDQRGVQARALGIRWVNVPLETITSAEVARQVHPLGDFGGWGLRGGLDGTRGLVTAEGEGLRIHRAAQPDWVLTVDDAARAAAVVNTLLARRDHATAAGQWGRPPRLG